MNRSSSVSARKAVYGLSRSSNLRSARQSRKTITAYSKPARRAFSCDAYCELVHCALLYSLSIHQRLCPAYVNVFVHSLISAQALITHSQLYGFL